MASLAGVTSEHRLTRAVRRAAVPATLRAEVARRLRRVRYVPIMRARHGIWSEVANMIEAGQVPRVDLTAATRVIVPPRFRGRPRLAPEGDRYAHWAMTTPARYPMVCKNVGCTKRLRKDQRSLTCSERCHHALLEYTQLVVEILEGRRPAEDFPYWARSRGGRRCIPRTHERRGAAR